MRDGFSPLRRQTPITRRRTTRARVRGDWGEFYHWAKVAVDVARISPQVEMDINEVTAIVAQEGRLGGRMLDIRAACALRPAREAVAAAILSMPTGKTAGLTAAPLPALLFAASG